MTGGHSRGGSDYHRRGPSGWMETGHGEMSESGRPSEWSVLTDLAVGARAGENEARERLAACVHDRAYRYSRAKLPQFPQVALAAERVAQAVCVAALVELLSYDEFVQPFDEVVHTICARAVGEACQAVMDESERGEELPELLGDSSDETWEAWHLLDQLPEQQRELLILRIAVGLSAEETGDSLGIPVGSVRAAQHRALVRLQRLMHEARGEE